MRLGCFGCISEVFLAALTGCHGQHDIEQCKPYTANFATEALRLEALVCLHEGIFMDIGEKYARCGEEVLQQ